MIEMSRPKLEQKVNFEAAGSKVIVNISCNYRLHIVTSSES